MRKHTFRKQMASLHASGADASIITQTLQALFTQIRRARAKDPNSQPPRNYKRKPSKYVPHQGARECERRRIGGFHAVKLFDKNMFSYGPLNRLI